MVYILAYRKPKLNPQAFRHHYDNIHVPLVKSLSGAKFPLSHTRHYIQRDHQGGGHDKANDTFPAVTLIGSPEDFSYDAYTELVFEDESAFREFQAVVSEPKVAARIREDEELFMDWRRSRAVVVDQMSQTIRADA